MMRERCSTDVAAQAGKASAATVIAASTSDLDANGTALIFTPLLGLNISPKRPLVPAMCSPLT